MSTPEKPKAPHAGSGETDAAEPTQRGGEDALIAAREGKADAARAHGKNPWPNAVSVSGRARVQELRTAYSSARIESEEADLLRYDAAKVAELSSGKIVTVLGRLMARRGFGKASFLVVRDATGELQVFAKADLLGEDFGALQWIDIADHVEVTGPLMVTKTGELSVEARSLRLIGKALRPLPDKFHGLSDVEQRYRRRYVDLVANPEAAQVIRARALVVAGLRDFLDRDGFVEVETPTLHSVVGGAAARPFSTHHNTLDLSLFLRIAPELYLKRLLVGGLERVYEIGRCYRNEGISTRHNPEFTMLEFYEAYATHETLMEKAPVLFRHVDAYLRRGLEALGLGATYTAWAAARPFTLDEDFRRVPMREAILVSLRSAGIEATLVDELHLIAAPREGAASDAPARAAIDSKIRDWASRSERAKGIDWGNLKKGLAACDSDGERLFIAYEYLAEPFLAQDYRSADGTRSVPVMITDYPAEVSPLARRKEGQPHLTDRFEIFVDGRELGNAFSELNDPRDQAERFRAQVEKKGRGDAEAMDYDEDYVRALEHGMPPAAGFGLGVDRLVMALTCQPSIREVIAFPLQRPESKE